MALILPDVNVLVHAFHTESRGHGRYAAWLGAVEESEDLALVDAALLGFVRIVTDLRIFQRPVSTSDALAFVDAVRMSRRARSVGPTEATWQALRRLLVLERGPRGNVVPDAWLAALAISHGARLATADRGFARFDGLDWFDPAQA